MSEFSGFPEICLGLEDHCEVERDASAERCEACRLYAAMQEEVWQPPKNLPTSLGARLRSMPEDFAEADPLYVRALAGETLGDEIPPGEAENPGRRAAHDALAVTFAEARRKRDLPPDLLARLRAIPRRSSAARLPVWLADSRWATAASLMLTSVLALAAGDVSARFQAIKDPAPIVRQLEAPDWKALKGAALKGAALEDSDWKAPDLAVQKAELQAWISATDERLTDASETATGEARSLAARFTTWRQTQTKELLESAQKMRKDLYEGASERLDQTVRTLEETKIGQFVVDLLQEGENDE